MLQGKGVQ